MPAKSLQEKHDSLRGAKGAPKYKDYILPMIFTKRHQTNTLFTMKHNEHLADHSQRLIGGKTLENRLNGRFYTPNFLTDQLVDLLIKSIPSFASQKVRLIDPFCGDGRLLIAFLHVAATSPKLKQSSFTISIWDNDAKAIENARKAIQECGKKLKTRVHVDALCCDAFLRKERAAYDILLTNPPWKSLKPDRRELKTLSPEARAIYIDALREYDMRLAKLLPNSQPEKKFSGWGTNLSRCGLELSVELIRPGGWCGIVLPTSLFNDQVSASLRRWLVEESSIRYLLSFPAEARLFDSVDQPCTAALIKRTTDGGFSPQLSRFDSKRRLIEEAHLVLSEFELNQLSYTIPLDLSSEKIRLLLRLSTLPKLTSLCGDNKNSLWLGREWDETGYKKFTTGTGNIPFIKGRLVSRYNVPNQFTDFVSDKSRDLPLSSGHSRIAWRDVSRRSQERRMIATILPPECVTGNSLHVAYFKDGASNKLHALLGIMNSLTFEFQLRSRLGTGHVSLGSIREVRIPSFDSSIMIRCLATLTKRVLRKTPGAEVALEVAVAHKYGLTRGEFISLLGFFDHLPASIREELLLRFDTETGEPIIDSQAIENKYESTVRNKTASKDMKIPNHYSANLSKLDLEIAVSVPPGGNWKDIPIEIPSKRIEQIRGSFASGKGSRSTYYGRLHPDRPSYTINTYFNRPGNGCHLHYDYDGGQHRVLSEREAARLQSFPDNYVFMGSHGAVQKQIGNAVPPLLAYQIAKSMPVVGQYVDLFSGAGGLSLGFKWAGWRPIVANDIEASFLDTYSKNIHPEVVCGDIRESRNFDAILESVTLQRKKNTPLLVIGGPPCQGFSTAGNKRSLFDERNHLFWEFKALVEAIRPDGFIFENVTGLLNMDGGAVFENIRRELHILDNPLISWVLSSDHYAVPQRRKRLFLLNLPKAWSVHAPPAPVTGVESEQLLFEKPKEPISVYDALSDLPALRPGEDGSNRQYAFSPSTHYQQLMRGVITPEEFLVSLTQP